MTRTLTILGASVRAAAFSARAAGFAPVGADLFGDVDLAAIAAVERIGHYPVDLIDYLSRSPSAPWMYTGALENYPELVNELAGLRLLYGNSGAALLKSRDPMFWSQALVEAGLPTPRVALSSAELLPDGSWMRKPLRSANGQGVCVWTADAARRDASPAESQRWYYQERIAGVPIAAIFVAAEGEAAILGVTRQLVGGEWRAAIQSEEMLGEAEARFSQEPGASARGLIDTERLDGSPFRYTGSIGPLVLGDEEYRNLVRIGEVLARECGLIGLFGIDAIQNSRNVWPVEINPRYTASIEVLERASAVRTGARRSRRLLSIECHELACLFRQLPAPLGQSDEVIAGKLIYYAPSDGNFTSAAARWAAEQNLAQSRPAGADIPAAGTVFHRGDPVVTLLADGPTASSVCSQLSAAASTLELALNHRG